MAARKRVIKEKLPKPVEPLVDVIGRGVKLLSEANTTKPGANFKVGWLDEQAKGTIQSVACYADFNYSHYVNKKPAAIMVVMHPPTDGGSFPEYKDAILAFTKWITSPQISPWKDILPKEYNGLYWNPEFIRDHGVLMTDLHIPGNALFNFLTAVRFTMEWYQGFFLWWNLVKSGVNPSFAFWFSHSFASQHCGILGLADKFRHVNIAGGHHSLQPDIWGEAQLTHFMSGVMPGMSTNPYDTHINYRPCNVVWGSSGGSYTQFLLKTYKGYDRNKPRPLSSEPLDLSFTLEKLIKVAQTEQQRLEIL